MLTTYKSRVIFYFWAYVFFMLVYAIYTTPIVWAVWVLIGISMGHNAYRWEQELRSTVVRDR